MNLKMPPKIPGTGYACPPELVSPLLYICLHLYERPEQDVADRILGLCLKRFGFTKKELYPWLRYALTGEDETPPIEALLYVFEAEESVYRLARFAATSLYYTNNDYKGYFIPEMLTDKRNFPDE